MSWRQTGTGYRLETEHGVADLVAPEPLERHRVVEWRLRYRGHVALMVGRPTLDHAEGHIARIDATLGDPEACSDAADEVVYGARRAITLAESGEIDRALTALRAILAAVDPHVDMLVGWTPDE